MKNLDKINGHINRANLIKFIETKSLTRIFFKTHQKQRSNLRVPIAKVYRMI